jgi:GTP pyrophosphokinase
MLAELTQEDVFVFTPAGDVKRLPRGATPVDFAYAVHTAVGHRCCGAKVNGRLVSLRTPLESGDVVEVQTGSAAAPSRDWLEFVVSAAARHKVRTFFGRRERDELAAAAAAPPEPLPPEPPPPAGLPDYSSFVRVAGVGRMEIRMARCCGPVPLAPLLGYVTSRGDVSIHRADCPTIRRRGSAARFVEAAWQLEDDVTRVGYLDVALYDEERGVPEVVRCVRRAGLRVAGVAAEKFDGGARCELHVRLATAARMKRAAKALEALKFVSAVNYRLS